VTTRGAGRPGSCRAGVGQNGFGRRPGRQSFREIGRATVAWASTAPHGIQSTATARGGGDGCGLHGARGCRGKIGEERCATRGGGGGRMRRRARTTRFARGRGTRRSRRPEAAAAARKAPRVNGVLGQCWLPSARVSSSTVSIQAGGGPVPPYRTIPSTLAFGSGWPRYLLLV
jgi:hypothetical protein